MVKRWLAVVTAALIALMTVGQPAVARPQDGILRGSGVTYSGGGWYGAYHLGNQTAYCIDLNSRGPSHASGWTQLPAKAAIYKQTGWGGAEAPYPTSGPVVSDREAAEMAYAMHVYGSGTPSAPRAIAMEHFVRLRTIAGSQQVKRENARWSTIALKKSPKAKAEFDRITAGTKRAAGPYAVKVRWQQRPRLAGSEGIARISVLSGSGVALSNLKVSVAASNLKVVSSPGKTNASGVMDVRVRATGAGEASVSASVSGLAPVRPTVWLPKNRAANVQRVITTAGATSARGMIKATIEARPTTPHLATQISSQIVKPGATLTDTVEVSGIVDEVGGKQVTNTVAGALLGPVPAVNGSCEAVEWDSAPIAAKIDPLTVTAGKSGYRRVEDLGKYTVPKDSEGDECYTYTETLTTTIDGEKPVIVDHQPGQVSQTALVRKIFKPVVTTQSSRQLVSGKTALTDMVSITGGKPGAKFEGTTRLYGPFETDPSVGPADLSNAPVVGVAKFAGVFDEHGEASVESDPVQVIDTGYYVFSEQLAGSDDWEPTEPAKPANTETSVNVTPKIATQISSQVSKPGATLTDTVEVSGIVDEVGGKQIRNTVAGALLGPVPAVNGSCEAVEWDSAPIAAKIDPLTVTAGKSGSQRLEGLGKFTIPSDAAGNECYTYTETLTVSADGEEDIVVDHNPGQQSQTTLVSTPSGGNASGGGIATGDVPEQGLSPLAVGGLVGGGLALLGAAVVVVVRRRSNVGEESQA